VVGSSFCAAVSLITTVCMSFSGVWFRWTPGSSFCGFGSLRLVLVLRVLNVRSCAGSCVRSFCVGFYALRCLPFAFAVCVYPTLRLPAHCVAAFRGFPVYVLRSPFCGSFCCSRSAVPFRYRRSGWILPLPFACSFVTFCGSVLRSSFTHGSVLAQFTLLYVPFIRLVWFLDSLLPLPVTIFTWLHCPHAV